MQEIHSNTCSKQQSKQLTRNNLCVVQCLGQCYAIGQLKIDLMDVWEEPGQNV